MEQKRQDFRPLKRRSIIFSTTLFMLVLVVGGVIFTLSMRQIIKTNKANELTKLLDNERIKLETPVSNRINIVLNMANSSLIQRYFITPDDKELEDMAFREFAGYGKALLNSTIFWISDTDKMFHSSDGHTFKLDINDPSNYWYNMTLRGNERFNFNINYNPDLNNVNLWINAQVLDDNRKPIGILGAGLDVSEFVNAIYENYKGEAELYFFNAIGEITGAKDIKLVTAKEKMKDKFGSAGAKIAAMTSSLKPGETQTFRTPLGEVGLCAVPTFGWYAMAVIPNSISDYKTAMTWLFFAMLFAMALIIVVYNIFMAKLFKPLRDTMNALEDALNVKNEFLRQMSHELRTPMNAITGMAELALREEMSYSAKDHVTIIRQACANLLTIVNEAFAATLPQKTKSAETENTDMPVNLSTGAPIEIFSAPNARILVTDDINTNLKVAAGLLAPYDVQIDTASSGAEAIKAVNANQYDIVFMDHMMPEMDGVETTRRIRESNDGNNQYLKNLPIIALTANAISGTKEMFLQNDFSDFLPKPIDIADLNALLKKWIPKEKQRTTGKSINTGEETCTNISIGGVDIKQGLARTGGTIDGYLQTLAVFYRDGQEKIEEINRCINNNNMPLYTTNVHALKSAAANIGAAKLSETAQSLEEAGQKNDKVFINAHTPRLLTDLKTLLSEIDKAITTEKEKNIKTDINKDTLNATLAKLREAIGNIDPDAISAAAKELREFENAPGIGSAIGNILQNVLDGEYEEAVGLIEGLIG